MGIYERGLEKTAANHVALSPTSFVERSAEVFGDLDAVVHGDRRYTWRETRDRSARLAAALRSLGVGRGTTVSAILHNTPEMVEAGVDRVEDGVQRRHRVVRLDHLRGVGEHDGHRRAAPDSE